MSKTKFTTEQMKLLRDHPYVIQISPNVVCFSKEFKEIIWTQMQRGRDIHEILEEYNLPCEILGETRIIGLKGMIRRAGKAGKGFSDVNSEACRSNGFKSPEKEIEFLKTQLMYKDQEIEFLKKIVSLGSGESTQ